MPTRSGPSLPPVLPDHAGFVIGVDGGGTKTLAWLASCNDSEAVPVGRGISGPSNPQAVGLETAQQNILTAIQRAFADAELPPVPLAAACLALAGVGREPIRREMLDWAEGVAMARHVRVVHDAQAVLAAGTRDGTGIAVICGTGSFAYGEGPSGTHARCGGWGYLFGDEGSGFQIGCAALRAIARAADGRGRSTSLTNLMLRHLQLTEPAQLIPAIYSASSARCAIAALTPVVFQAAADGDSVAEEIRADGAEEVSQLIRGITRQLEFAHGQYDLALTGGVFGHQPAWGELIVRILEQQRCAPRATHIVSDPVAGAVVLARHARLA